MSHVATIEIEITNLQDLRAACADLGLEFADGQETYHWYGKHVGDFPLPDGFQIEDLGRCQHAIKLKNPLAVAERERQRILQEHPACPPQILANIRPYEIGVVPRRDGKPGWTLLWDFFEHGFGLEAAIGPNAGLLKQAIATAASIRTMTAQGYRCLKKPQPNGVMKLEFVRG